MNNALLVPIICAVLSPFIEGLMNIADKYVATNKVRNPLSFTVVLGFVSLSAGMLLSLFLDWGIVSALQDVLSPVIAGIIFGSQYFLYYHLLSKEDASNVIGLIYVYPVIVALLSFFFLDERLSFAAYIGMGLILFGGLMLSGGIRSFSNGAGIWSMALIIALVALHEFFIKVATNHLPELHGIAVSLISLGLTLSAGLLHRKTRLGFRDELENIGWAVSTESLTILGLATIYFAMAGLPATIVATIAATQPLVVLLLEKVFHRCGIRICSDQRLMPKLMPISVIVAGIVIMYQVVEP